MARVAPSTSLVVGESQKVTLGKFVRGAGVCVSVACIGIGIVLLVIGGAAGQTGAGICCGAAVRLTKYIICAMTISSRSYCLVTQHIGVQILPPTLCSVNSVILCVDFIVLGGCNIFVNIF